MATRRSGGCTLRTLSLPNPDADQLRQFAVTPGRVLRVLPETDFDVFIYDNRRLYGAALARVRDSYTVDSAGECGWTILPFKC